MCAKPNLQIVIVNWNSGEQLAKCLKSISVASQENFFIGKIVVVDNASTDNFMEKMKEININLDIVKNRINMGFAAACNKGAAHCIADYLLFLNPDTKLQIDSLNNTIKFMERPENSRIGICGVQLMNEREQVARTCARFPTTGTFLTNMLGLDRLWPKKFPPHFMVEWNHAETRQVDQVMGAFFFVRCSLFEALGGFDERFFVYFEEVDFSLRALQADWKTYYLAESRVYHQGGGTTEQVKAIRLFYSLRSRIWYGYKHFNMASATILALATLIVEPITRVGLAIARGSGESVVETLGAYGQLWREMLRALLSLKSRLV